jgi:hypothetical protein
VGLVRRFLDRRRERRLAAKRERMRGRLCDALEAYEQEVKVIRPPFDMSRAVDTSLPVRERAEAALPLLRRGHADFRAACDRVASRRDEVARIAAQAGIADAIGPGERQRVHRVVELRSGESAMAAIERQWCERIAKYERWARTLETEGHGPVAFDRRDHMGPGWWHGP